MKKIKLDITASYDIGYTVEVPDNVYKELIDIVNKHDGTICDDDIEVDSAYKEAWTWLNENVDVKDWFNLRYEDIDVEESEEKK